AGAVPADIPTDRFAIAGHHVQPFYLKSKYYLDMFAVSDDLFLREINTFSFSAKDDLALRSTRYTTSRTGLYKGWAGGLLWGETAYNQDLIDAQDFALQRLPRVEGEQSKPLLDGRLVGRLAGTGVNYQRDQGFDGVRGDIAPDLMWPFRLGRALNGSITGRLRETVYQLTSREQVEALVPDPGSGLRTRFQVAPDQPSLDETEHRELAEVRARTGTEFSRVFDFRHLGLEKVKHTVEPEVQYLFVPTAGFGNFGRTPTERREVVDCSEMPGGTRGTNCNVTVFRRPYLFDEVDAINHRNFFSYGITTRLLGRGPVSAAPAPAAGVAAAEVPAAEPPMTDAEAESPDPDILPQGLPLEAVPVVVGPPAPGTPAPGATTAPRELARATVLHGYDVSRTLVGDSHQSDVDFGIRVTPVDYLGMTYNTTVSLEQ